MPRLVLAAVLALGACSQQNSEPEPDPLAEAKAKCPHVDIDNLEADWILFTGKADHKFRLRIFRKGDAYAAYYVGGFFDHMTMSSERRPEEIVFTEVPTARKKAFVDKGEATLTRLFAKPKLKKCALEVFVAKVDGAGKEVLDPRPKDFVEFPANSSIVLSYEPDAEPLFLGAAAKDKKKADKELEELGMPNPGSPLSEHLPTGGWSKVSEDGDPSCKYDMDLYFDDQRKEEKVPAGKVQGEFRTWYHEWYAPYGGNHHFQFYRYRTCSDGQRTLLGVMGVEAALG
jgi:hypothetical protein